MDRDHICTDHARHAQKEFSSEAHVSERGTSCESKSVRKKVRSIFFAKIITIKQTGKGNLFFSKRY